VIFLKDVPDGWWRQLCGANYYNAVVQFLQAEKKIRLRSLVSMGYDIKEIKLIFEDAKNKRSEQQKEEIESFVRDLEGFHFTDEGNIQESDQAILYYIAGYIAKSLSNQDCNFCSEVLSPGKVPLAISFEEREIDTIEAEAKEEFIASVDRGGLTKPFDFLFIASLHASELFKFITKDVELKNTFFSTTNPRDTFVESYEKILESDNSCDKMINGKCEQGHSFRKFIRRVSYTTFNISAKNYVSEKNDSIRKKTEKQSTKKITEKQNKSTRKIKKLQSQ